MDKRIYIILGLGPQGLALLRELGKNDVEVIAFCTSQHNVGYHSRYGRRIVYHTVNELKIGIQKILDVTKQKPICYITSGEILASILTEFKEIYDLCEVFSAPYEVVEKLAHKDLMYEIAVRNGMKVARYATLDKYQKGMLQYPLFLKRNYEIPLFFKAVKIENEEILNSYIERIPTEHFSNVIVQEFIDIPSNRLINLSCQGFFVDGESNGMYLANQKRRLKKGLTSYIEEITDKRITDSIYGIVKSFMSELKYSGFAEFEFMLDVQSDILYFIEVNTRTCGSQSGLHYKYSNISDVLLYPRNKTQLIVKTDCLKWMNIVRDVRARLESKDFHNLMDIFHTHYDILQWDDFKPFIFQFIRK